jgi:phosphoglycolate phosphatase
MFKNIIFDWSGVVKDAVRVQFWVVNKMFEKFGVKEISYDEFRKNWEQPYMKFYNKYIPDLTEEDQTRAYLKAMADKDCPPAQEYPGISDLIKKLKKRGKFLIILSSDWPETILPEIKKFGLENIFDDKIIAVHDKTKSMKEIMERHSLNPKEAVLIGDSNHEMEIAREVGIKSIAVIWGFCTEENLITAKPDYLVHNIKELEEILLK